MTKDTKEPADPYASAIRELNVAAYKAVSACRDTTRYPMVNRAALRQLCTITDKLWDEHRDGECKLHIEFGENA
jgi:hypothetical protein